MLGVTSTSGPSSRLQLQWRGSADLRREVAVTWVNEGGGKAGEANEESKGIEGVRSVWSGMQLVRGEKSWGRRGNGAGSGYRKRTTWVGPARQWVRGVGLRLG